ncbi:MAG: glycoside hydrolase family 97 C-terminal domain-containing protein, partial [Anaerolineales bacterium]
EFLKEVPTTWEDTKVLSGEVSDHIIIARKKGERWFIGGMNNSEPKNVTIHLDFLPEGKCTMSYFKDSPESNTDPTVIVKGTERLSGGEYYQIRMEKGGGFAAYIDLK